MALANFEYPTDVYNLQNPQEVLPVVMQYVKPESVLDVGCGIAVWLKGFVDLGITDYLGIDGDYVLKQDLQIPKEHFKVIDLTTPFNLGRRFDLAMCLEVAEHLPETAANVLVASLCQHSDTILFSAAIPMQQGNGHINEQWASYWQQKFKHLGYDFYDLIRPQIWDNKKVQYLYRQNIFIVAKQGSSIAEEYVATKYIDFVHPEMYLYHARQSERCTLIEDGKAGWQIPLTALWKTIKHKLFGKK